MRKLNENTLGTSVQQQFGDKAQKEVLVETHGEAEIGPVVSKFHALESIALEVHLAIEVFLVENLHGDLALASVGGAVMVAVELKIVLHGTTSILGLFGLAGRNRRRHGPEHHQDGNGGEDGKEDGGIETPTDLTSQVPGDQGEQGEQKDIGEAITTSRIRRDRGIFDGRVLERTKVSSGKLETKEPRNLPTLSGHRSPPPWSSRDPGESG